VALTYDAAGAVGEWTRREIPVDRQLPKPSPLFKKLDDSVVADEFARLGPRPD
jgi:methionyl-tRNA synthetase